MPKERELPEQAICLECGKGFNLLNCAHLRTHGFENRDAYRQVYNLSENIPFHSRYLSELLSRIDSPAKISLWRQIGLDFQQNRKSTFERLAHVGLFTPKTASELTGIPITTLQSAMQEDRLSFGLTCLIIDSKRGIAKGGITKIVKLDDLYDFVNAHKPYGRR